MSEPGVYWRRQLRTQPPHQPLRDDAQRGRGDHEGLDADVGQARHRRRRIVGVQRREHEVAGLRGLHRDARRSPGRGFRRPGSRPGPGAGSIAGRSANVSLIFSLICVWLMPGSWYSIGSSMVMTLVRSDCSDISAEHSVVVLPLPVGPTTEDHAVLELEKALQIVEGGGREPQLLERRHAAVLVEDAQHHLLAVQRAQRRGAEVDVLPSSVGTRTRPSWGRRFSAMSMPAMILRRAIRPSWTHLGRSITSFNRPSRRWRMRTPFSIGSTCTSEAPALMALFTTRSTRSMIGAASLRSFRPAIGSIAAVLVGAAHQRFVVGRLLEAVAHRRDLAGDGRGLDQRLVGIAGGDRLEDVGTRRDDLLDAIAGLELEILHEAEEQRIGHRHGEQVLVEANGDARSLERDVFRESA